MKQINGGVTAAKGFNAQGGHVGIKADDIKDMALIVSEVPANCAAAFTTNVVKAASVQRNIEVMKKQPKICGIAVNSGNANACTGEEGKASNLVMAETLAAQIGCDTNQVLTASTGVIGVQPDPAVYESGIKELFPKICGCEKAAENAAWGILTTDTHPKQIAVEIEIGGKTVTIGAMAKGTGMICPNMATMLAFVTTDCCISAGMLDKALKATIGTTYNMVSVDGDTSTNDSIFLLANGLAENAEITAEGPDYETFKDALYFVNEYLAKELVRDGEGATKFIETEVINAASEDKARAIAKSVIKSSLLKAAIFGSDANWGRVLCAMGYSGEDFDPEKVDVTFRSAKGELEVLKEGTPIVFDEDKALEILGEDDITIIADLKEGAASGKAWGCDLTYEYVKINGEYRS
ncbi:MAG: bifunctional ornithine acetyltransferase/N-acetylglutamate synthase [Firmicutes bacterium]|nr:bifunctional ornithine acetyltransferase/N-acetylglutamate synthase [Bacillota bacterium]